MSTNIDVSAIDSNPVEVDSVGNFIVERTFSDPVLNSIHTVWTGIQMKEQIVFASQLDKVGIKDSGCARPNSGAGSILTQKYWEPVGMGDTLVHCQKDVDALFKAYYGKIQKYVDLYDISGSELEQFMSVLLSEAIMRSILRTVWLGDKAVAVSEAAATGLKLAADVKFYNQLDGFWAQIFDAVTATDVTRITITENTLATISAQTTLASGRASEIFELIWEKADSRLRKDETKQFLVSREIFENYRKELQKAGENFTIDYTVEGLPSLKWNSVLIVNMETVWDDNLRNDFEEDSTDNLYILPNRVILTTPSNLPIGTLNETDMSELDVWYEKKERQMYSAFGYTLDAKLLEPYMIVVAY